MTSPHVQIDLLGGFRVRIGEHEVNDDAWRRRKPAAVLKLLALEPSHRMHREQLMDLLWPDLDATSGGANLRKAIHHARRALDDTVAGTAAVVASDGEFVALAGEGMSIDVDQFRSGLAGARRSADADGYARALELYGGDLLPDDRYEDWAQAPRRDLAGTFVDALSELAALQEAAGELAAALETARRLVTADLLREESHVTLMRLFALSGRRTDAVRQYERLEQLLDEELGTSPGADAQRLCAEIRSRHDAEPELAADLWERVGDLRIIAGDAVGAANAYTQSLAASMDEAARSRVERKCGEAWLMQHRPEEAEPHLEAARNARSDAAEQARLLRATANHAWERGDIAEAQRLARKALDAAIRDGVGDDVAAAHEAIAIVSHFQGRWREGLISEVARLGTDDAGPALARVSDIHHCIGQYHLYGDGLHDSVEAYARQLLKRAEQAGAPRAEAFAWCLLGETLLLQGRWDEADGCLARSCALHGSFRPLSGALPWQRRAELAACRGDHDEVKACLREASAIATTSPMGLHLWGRIHATAALSFLEESRAERAVLSVQAAAAAAARYGDCPTCSALLNPVAAEAHSLLGDRDGAESYAQAAARVATFFASSAWRAMAESAAGSAAIAAGDEGRAREHFASARDLYEAAGQPYWAERTSRLVPAVI